MKNLLLALAVVLALGAPAVAQWPKEGKAYATFTYDLTGDGRPERISLVAYGVTQDEYYGQLVVTDASGSVLWKGPRSRKTPDQDPLSFGAWNWGVSDIEAVGDLEANGRCEIFSALPQSDVRPVRYRILQWTGRGFGYLRVGALMRKGDRFAWTRNPPDSGTWIHGFEKVLPDGTCRVKVLKYDGGSSVSEGIAIVRADAGGFRVVRWAQPLRRSG